MATLFVDLGTTFFLWEMEMNGNKHLVVSLNVTLPVNVYPSNLIGMLFQEHLSLGKIRKTVNLTSTRHLINVFHFKYVWECVFRDGSITNHYY